MTRKAKNKRTVFYSKFWTSH